MVTKKPPRSPAQAPHVLSERFADPDLVDRIFEYVLELMPEIAGRADEVKAAVRDEFKGEEVYVTARSRGDLTREVLSRFNGRNASEVARALGIGRATVYRMLKQAGRTAG